MSDSVFKPDERVNPYSKANAPVASAAPVAGAAQPVSAPPPIVPAPVAPPVATITQSVSGVDKQRAPMVSDAALQQSLRSNDPETVARTAAVVSDRPYDAEAPDAQAEETTWNKLLQGAGAFLEPLSIPQWQGYRAAANLAGMLPDTDTEPGKMLQSLAGNYAVGADFVNQMVSSPNETFADYMAAIGRMEGGDPQRMAAHGQAVKALGEHAYKALAENAVGKKMASRPEEPLELVRAARDFIPGQDITKPAWVDSARSLRAVEALDQVLPAEMVARVRDTAPEGLTASNALWSTLADQTGRESVGLLGDVALDPLNLIGAGAGKTIVRFGLNKVAHAIELPSALAQAVNRASDAAAITEDAKAAILAEGLANKDWHKAAEPLTQRLTDLSTEAQEIETALDAAIKGTDQVRRAQLAEAIASRLETVAAGADVRTRAEFLKRASALRDTSGAVAQLRKEQAAQTMMRGQLDGAIAGLSRAKGRFGKDALIEAGRVPMHLPFGRKTVYALPRVFSSTPTKAIKAAAVKLIPPALRSGGQAMVAAFPELYTTLRHLPAFAVDIMAQAVGSASRLPRYVNGGQFPFAGLNVALPGEPMVGGLRALPDTTEGLRQTWEPIRQAVMRGIVGAQRTSIDGVRRILSAADKVSAKTGQSAEDVLRLAIDEWESGADLVDTNIEPVRAAIANLHHMIVQSLPANMAVTGKTADGAPQAFNLAESARQILQAAARDRKAILKAHDAREATLDPLRMVQELTDQDATAAAAASKAVASAMAAPLAYSPLMTSAALVLRETAKAHRVSEAQLLRGVFAMFKDGLDPKDVATFNAGAKNLRAIIGDASIVGKRMGGGDADLAPAVEALRLWVSSFQDAARAQGHGAIKSAAEMMQDVGIMRYMPHRRTGDDLVAAGHVAEAAKAGTSRDSAQLAGSHDPVGFMADVLRGRELPGTMGERSAGGESPHALSVDPAQWVIAGAEVLTHMTGDEMIAGLKRTGIAQEFADPTTAAQAGYVPMTFKALANLVSGSVDQLAGREAYEVAAKAVVPGSSAPSPLEAARLAARKVRGTPASASWAQAIPAANRADQLDRGVSLLGWDDAALQAHNAKYPAPEAAAVAFNRLLREAGAAYGIAPALWKETLSARTVGAAKQLYIPATLYAQMNGMNDVIGEFVTGGPFFTRMANKMRGAMTAPILAFHANNNFGSAFQNLLHLGAGGALNPASQLKAWRLAAANTLIRKYGSDVSLGAVEARDKPMFLATQGLFKNGVMLGGVKYSVQEATQKLSDLGVLTTGYAEFSDLESFIEQIATIRNAKADAPLLARAADVAAKAADVFIPALTISAGVIGAGLPLPLVLPRRIGQAIGNYVESVARGTAFQGFLDEGQSFDEAAQNVQRIHFNYNDLTAFQRKTLRTLFMFPTWTVKTVQTTMDLAVNDPASLRKFYAVFYADGPAISASMQERRDSADRGAPTTYATTANQSVRAEYAQGDVTMPIPGLKPGTVLTGFQTPVEATADAIYAGLQLARACKELRIPDKLLAWAYVNVAIQGVGDMLAEKDLATGQDVSNASGAEQVIGTLVALKGIRDAGIPVASSFADVMHSSLIEATGYSETGYSGQGELQATIDPDVAAVLRSNWYGAQLRKVTQAAKAMYGRRLMATDDGQYWDASDAQLLLTLFSPLRIVDEEDSRRPEAPLAPIMDVLHERGEMRENERMAPSAAQKRY